MTVGNTLVTRKDTAHLEVLVVNSERTCDLTIFLTIKELMTANERFCGPES